jgi:hypothetical protein
VENFKENIKNLGKNKIYLIIIGLAAIILATILIYAYSDFSGTEISKIKISNEKPYCGAIGSRSEGWYIGSGSNRPELIRWDNCEGCVAECKLIGTRSEGWYSSCDGERIKYDNCGEKSCYSDSDCRGITIPIGKEEWLIETTFDVIPMMIQSLRDGHNIEAEKISNSELRIIVDAEQMDIEQIEFIKEYEWVKKITKRSQQFCEFPEEECKGPGKCVDKLVNGGCATVWDPVCGCDGKTYSNDCFRNMAGVSKKYDGECEAGDCAQEGESVPVVPGAKKCCPGLKKISCEKPNSNNICPTELCGGASICANCGNGICGSGENKCNCPEDCKEEADCIGDGEILRDLQGKKGDCCSGLHEISSGYRNGVTYCTSEVCGNGECKALENKWNCSKDCGTETDVDTDISEISCDDICKTKGYDYGICRSTVVYLEQEPCQENEKNIGETAGCYVTPGLVGVKKACCCANYDDGNSGNCTDSDGGINQYVKGTTCQPSITDVTRLFCKTDVCDITSQSLKLEGYDPTRSYPIDVDTSLLLEYYCKDGKMMSKHIECENGCKDGACKREAVEPACTDTDGGRDYYKKGTVTLKKISSDGSVVSVKKVEDVCDMHNEANSTDEKATNMLHEYYCNGSEIASESFYCPNGCVDGACVIGDEPYCTNIGSRSEGWVGDGITDIMWDNEIPASMWEDKTPDIMRIGIIWDNCDGCYAVCKAVGTSSEGWYSSGSCETSGKLIKYANCGEAEEDCRDENYGCTPEAIPCCSGLKEVNHCFPEGDDCICATCGSICRPCGNGVCDANENKCNCPEDCKEKETLFADLNCDGNVNLTDSAILLSFWGKDPSGSTSCQSPDINQDGSVNLADFSIIMSQWTK